MRSLLTLGTTRRLLRRPRYRLLAVGISGIYAFGAMLLGGMLAIFIPPARLVAFWVLLPSGTPNWDYPALLVVTPNFTLGLPFLPTVAMALVAAGVGLGMSVAVLLGAGLVRQRRVRSARPAAAGALAGLTPAMIALVTLGACCSTTAAATAGIGLAAQASGTSPTELLANAWYLPVFQLGILWVALLAQEQLLVAYGPSLGLLATRIAPASSASGPTRRWILLRSGALRAALLAGATAWSLSMFAAWTATSPVTASGGTWVEWVLLHQWVAGFALAAALSPRELGPWLLRGTVAAKVVRGSLLLAGALLVAWLPGVVVGLGLHGLGNELAAVGGWPGGVDPGVSGPWALGLRWTFEYLLLGSFAIATSIAPSLVGRALATDSEDRRSAAPVDADARGRVGLDRSGRTELPSS